MPDSDGVVFVPDIRPDPRVHVFRRTIDLPGEFDSMEVDSYIVVTRQYIVVFDTLVCPEDMATVMHYVQDDIPRRQLLVVNSHADWDHCWGNAYFTGEHFAPIIAHDYCRVRMESAEEAQGLQEYQQRFGVFRNVQLISPTITFSETLTIHGGDLTIHLLPAPGHHPDHIAAWIPQLRLLLAFDAIEKPIPVVQEASSIPSMFATLEQFTALQAQVVLCSHGKSTTPQLIRDNLSYFRNIEQRGRAFLASQSKDTLTEEELAHPSALLHYPFEEVIANHVGPLDTAFYSWAHDANMRAILQWLMNQSKGEKTDSQGYDNGG